VYLTALEPWFDVVEHKLIGNMLFASVVRRVVAGT
jgi:hypothetical protein